MDAERKRQWVEALRSGEYAQCRNALSRDGGYCCLGVLCNVVDPSGWGDSLYGSSFYTYKNEGDDSVPPSSLCTEVGLGSDDLDFLVKANDNEMWGFNKIADWVEEHL